jgi:hypothetical protein
MIPGGDVFTIALQVLKLLGGPKLILKNQPYAKWVQIVLETIERFQGLS